MEQRIYHGEISPKDFANALYGHFHRGNFKVQRVGSGSEIIIQIMTNQYRKSGGDTAISISIRKVEDGVSIQIGKQAWMGVAASLGLSVLSTIRNPLNLLSRIDDIAQDIESLQITDQIWEVIEATAKEIGTGKQLSDRLRRMVCDYCNTANPVGTSRCIACGAPLGDVQPEACPHCGFVIHKDDRYCPNCKKLI